MNSAEISAMIDRGHNAVRDNTRIDRFTVSKIIHAALNINYPTPNWDGRINNEDFAVSTFLIREWGIQRHGATVVHMPTGIQVQCAEHRTTEANKHQAYREVLRQLRTKAHNLKTYGNEYGNAPHNTPVPSVLLNSDPVDVPLFLHATMPDVAPPPPPPPPSPSIESGTGGDYGGGGASDSYDSGSSFSSND